MLALAVACAVVGVPLAAASDSWTDIPGDAHGAPDIRSLYLQDNWGGKTGRMSFQPSTSFGAGTLTLEIDADMKAATGGSEGSDYRVVWNNETERVTRLLRWNGSRFVSWKSPLVEPYAYTVNIYARAIGNPKKFRLWLHSALGAGADRAPNKGYWTHALATTGADAGPFTLSDAVAGPGGIHAGKPFTLTATANRTIPAPKVECSGRIGSRYLTFKASYAARAVTCSSTALAGTAGQQLVGTITAASGGYQSSSGFSLTVDR